MISKSFVMRCLNSGGTVHYRKSRNSAAQPNQGSSVPQQSSAADEAKIAPPRQAARIRLEGLTYLNQASKISGKLYFEGPAEIDGQIEGEIVAKVSILIGESAVVIAPIMATSIIVAGNVKGDIIGTQRIELLPSAKVLGKLTAPNLVVHKGAMFEGHVHANGTIQLEIEQEISNVVNPDQPTLTPTISERRIHSTVAVTSGQTVLLGGLISEQVQRTNSGLPGLRQIQILGDLLTNNTATKQRSEIIIFMRSQLIRNGTDARHVAEEFRDRLESLRHAGPALVRKY